MEGAIKLDDRNKHVYPELYIDAERLWKPRTTLKALGIRIYLQRLHNEGFEGINERVIARDLQKFHQWLDEDDLRREKVTRLPLGKEPATYLIGETWKFNKRPISKS